jgi:aminoglycoside phosphotransferase family enzyme/predicted kinase
MSAIQDEVFAFLCCPEAWPDRPARVETIDTHGARVFLAGNDVLKIKRAICLPYLDFSTLEARKHFCEREIALNSAAAPGLYRGVVAITREHDGSLAISGDGTPVEWAVRMHRFNQDDLLLHVVKRGAFTREMAEDLADAVYRQHQSAAVAPFSAANRATLDNISRVAGNVLTSLEGHCGASRVSALAHDVERELTARMLAERAEAGRIRRCHGDLHLGNIVLWQGKPVPFDALEFDEDLATIDTLYDLAFLLMDLDRHGARDMANAVLNRYLWRSRDLIDIDGLALLPMFLSLRAAIRAMVTFDRIGSDPANAKALRGEAMAILDDAFAYLDGRRKQDNTPAPQLIAVGGLSGTGKTTLARKLAPLIGPAPGALHLRSDMERKALAGAEPLERLAPSAYTQASSDAVYDCMFERAHHALDAGHCVVLDAVFAREDERAQAEHVARAVHAGFTGLWLEGTQAMLAARVSARTNDASDATADVVAHQFGYDIGHISWQRLNAGGGVDELRARAMAALAPGADRRRQS